MLRAMNQNGNLVTLALLGKQEIQFHKNNSSFICPHCQEKVIAKAGNCIIPHFAHHPNSLCPITSGGEGEYHERGKLDLYRWFVRQGIHAELEFYLPEIKQRPDILLVIGKKVIAIEYQCASISINEFLRRNQGYQKLKISPIWILGGNRMKRNSEIALQFRNSELMFLHKFSQRTPLSLYYYCPDTSLLSVVQHIQTTGKKKVYANLHFRNLTQLNVSNLWKETPYSRNTFLAEWNKDKKRFRTIPSLHTTIQERQWLQWLYIHQMHPSTLPAIIYLPVPSQFRMKSPPWIWQSKIVHYFLIQKIQFTIQMCERLLRNELKNSSCFPLVKAYQNPITEYLELLVQLNKLQQISSFTFQSIGEIKQYHMVDEAIKQDHKVMNQIKSLQI